MGMPKYLEKKFRLFLLNEPSKIFEYGTYYNDYYLRRGHTFNPMSYIKWMWKLNNLISKDNENGGLIYFIENKTTNLIKIGFTSRSVEERKLKIEQKFFNNIKLCILGTVPGTMDDEKKLHGYFYKQRVYDEWFEPNMEIKKFIIWSKYRNSHKKIYDKIGAVHPKDIPIEEDKEFFDKFSMYKKSVGFDYENYNGKTDAYILYVFDNWNKITSEKMSLRNLAKEVKKILPVRMRNKGGGYSTCNKVLKKYGRKK